MLTYTGEEKVQIIKWYYSGSTAQEVVGRFIFAFENRPVPTVATVLNIVHKFESTHCVANCQKCIDMSKEPRVRVISEERERREINVCSAVENSEPCSSRQISEQVGINDRTVRNILKRHGYRSYKIGIHQEIFPRDLDNRIRFCELLMQKVVENPNFLFNILFTDESSFYLHGLHNSAATRYWSTTNKHHSLRLRTQYPQKLNVWAGILGDNIIGPFFIDGTLTAAKYLALLQDQIMAALRALNIDYRDIWFQQDNCPAHTARVVQLFLRETFGDKLISTRTAIAWPPRSPDLTPLDFFFWGHIKQSIYTHQHVRAQNLDELRQKIIDAASSITAETLLQVREELYYRLGFCQEQRGDLFEHLL